MIWKKNGFEHEYNIQSKKSGGRVSLIISNKVNSNIQRKDIKLNSKFNCIEIEISTDQLDYKSNIVIILMYRPPSRRIPPKKKITGGHPEIL